MTGDLALNPADEVIIMSSSNPNYRVGIWVNVSIMGITDILYYHLSVKQNYM